MSLRSRRPDEAALNAELENLGAAMALGEVTETEARSRKQDIARRQGELTKALEESDRQLALLAPVRVGLQRRIDEERAKLEALESRTAEVLQAFLLAEAERACAVYVEAGHRIIAAWLQIEALQTMLRYQAGFRGDVLGYLGRQLRLPVIKLPQCAGLGHPNWSHGAKWFDAESPYMAQSEQEAREAEAARIRALGVRLI